MHCHTENYCCVLCQTAAVNCQFRPLKPSVGKRLIHENGWTDSQVAFPSPWYPSVGFVEVTHHLVPIRILPTVFLGLGDILASKLKVTKRGKRISAGTVLSLQKSFVISLTSVYRSRDLETMTVMMILKLQMKSRTQNAADTECKQLRSAPGVCNTSWESCL